MASFVPTALFTDLYELTMAQAYWADGMNEPASFELYFRKLPAAWRYVVAAGLADVLAAIERFKFSDDDLTFLRQQDEFSDDFCDFLATVSFTGDVWALPEGTPVFPYEPLLRIEAPLIEAQLLETLIVNRLHLQSILATKAARVVTAAEGRTVVDFGSRRAHGVDAALQVARCSWLAGAAGTSNVQAGQTFDIPTYGTMAHSYVQAFDHEERAFERFASLNPQSTLLVDTYDTISGVKKAIRLHQRQGGPITFRAVRLDSGDLGALAKQTRSLLDEAGLDDVQIFASSSLDEHKIQELLKSGAPIDGFGVGTKLAVSADVNHLDMAYKLVAYDGKPRTKLSQGKKIYPGPKQVYRQFDQENGQLMMKADVVAASDEPGLGQPLLVAMMEAGQRLPAGRVTLHESRAATQRHLASLPPAVRKIAASDEEVYPVQISAKLQQQLHELEQQLASVEVQPSAPSVL